MTQTNIEYYWVKFYLANSPKNDRWQIVKFWTENGKRWIKGLDWGTEHLWDDWHNKDFIRGAKIDIPEG